MLQKDKLKFAFKLGVGGLLVYYVLRSKMIDFSSLKTIITSPLNLLDCGVLPGIFHLSLQHPLVPPRQSPGGDPKFRPHV